jgi:hypothetical protein
MNNRSAPVKAACRLSDDKSNEAAMKDGISKGKDERAERLAQQLRANLHRRKAQARALDDKPEKPENTD